MSRVVCFEDDISGSGTQKVAHLLLKRGYELCSSVCAAAAAAPDRADKALKERRWHR